jgi:ribosome-associated toxin RatA of RatAB toxin-antitoxin module
MDELQDFSDAGSDASNDHDMVDEMPLAVAPVRKIFTTQLNLQESKDELKMEISENK